MNDISESEEKSAVQRLVSQNVALFPASLFFLSIEMPENAAENLFSSAFSIIKSLFHEPNICVADSQKELRIAIFSSLPVDERILKTLLQNELPSMVELVIASAGVSRSEKDILDFLIQ